MISSAGARGLERAHELQMELEDLGAGLSEVDGFLLLVVAPIGAITPAIRDRIAHDCRELISLIAELEAHNPWPDPPASSRLPSTAMGMITGILAAHRAVVITMLGPLVATEIVTPDDVCDGFALAAVIEERTRSDALRGIH